MKKKYWALLLVAGLFILSSCQVKEGDNGSSSQVVEESSIDSEEEIVSSEESEEIEENFGDQNKDKVEKISYNTIDLGFDIEKDLTFDLEASNTNEGENLLVYYENKSDYPILPLMLTLKDKKTDQQWIVNQNFVIDVDSFDSGVKGGKLTYSIPMEGIENVDDLEKSLLNFYLYKDETIYEVDYYYQKPEQNKLAKILHEESDLYVSAEEHIYVKYDDLDIKVDEDQKGLVVVNSSSYPIHIELFDFSYKEKDYYYLDESKEFLNPGEKRVLKYDNQLDKDIDFQKLDVFSIDYRVLKDGHEYAIWYRNMDRGYEIQPIYTVSELMELK